MIFILKAVIVINTQDYLTANVTNASTPTYGTSKFYSFYTLINYKSINTLKLKRMKKGKEEKKRIGCDMK